MSVNNLPRPTAIASGPSDIYKMADNTNFMTCNECGQADLRMKPTRFGTLFIACQGYPNCKNSMNMPKGITHLKMLTPDMTRDW